MRRFRYLTLFSVHLSIIRYTLVACTYTPQTLRGDSLLNLNKDVWPHISQLLQISNYGYDVSTDRFLRDPGYTLGVQ